MLRTAALGLVLLAAAVPSQTFVVDAAGGPGTHFTTLTAAVAAVPSGATLVVRAGSYAGFSVAGKGFAIRGEPGVTIDGQIAITATQIGQPVELRGLTLASPLYVNQTVLSQLVLTDCADLVLLADLEFLAQGCLGPQCAFQSSLRASSCDQLMIRDCSVEGHVELVVCAATIDGCALRGRGISFHSSSSTPGVTILGGTIVLADNMISGGLGSFSNGVLVGGSPGVDVVGSTSNVRILRGAVYSPLIGPPVAIAVHSLSAFRLDPAVHVIGNAPAPLARSLPALVATDAPPGGSFTAAARTAAGDPLIVVLGFRGPPLAIAGVVDELWLDPTVFAFVAFGVPPAGQPLTASVAVPNNPAFVGTQFAWQAVGHDANANTLQASNPGISTVL